MYATAESRRPVRLPVLAEPGRTAQRAGIKLPQSPHLYSSKGFSMSHVVGGLTLWGAFSIAGLCIVLLASTM